MKKEENYIKKGEKALKNASFWAINSKKNLAGSLKTTTPDSTCRRVAGGASPRPPQTYFFWWIVIPR